MAKSYQITNVFPHLTVHENVRVAVQSYRYSFNFWSRASDLAGVRDKAAGILREVALAEKAELLAANLSHGEKRHLELGIALGGIALVLSVLLRFGLLALVVTFYTFLTMELFPLTIDELVEAAALLRAVQRGDLDRTPQPAAPLDILAQQIVAACVAAGETGWFEDQLYAAFKRAWPYRDLSRDDFDAVIAMHTDGRRGLLHRDGVGRRAASSRRSTT